MPYYSIADLRVEIQNQYEYLTRQCKEYTCEQGAPADMTIRVTEEALQQERLHAKDGCSAGYLESICAYRALCLQLPRYDGLLLHASVISCAGHGIAFLAPSGVGKTTHTLLWRKLPHDVTVVNGDKPILRFFDGVPYAYGTPWAGKEGLQTNTRVAVTDLGLIERSAVNEVVPMGKAAFVAPLMRQLLMPKDEENAVRTLELANRLLSACRLWKIRCNITPSAAETAYSTIIGGAE